MAGVVLKLLVLKTPHVAKLRAFYEALGIAFAEERHGQGPLHYSSRVGETVLEIYPLAEEVIQAAAIRIGFAVADLNAVVARVQEAGARLVDAPRDTVWGRRAVVRDSDGRAVELYEL